MLNSFINVHVNVHPKGGITFSEEHSFGNGTYSMEADGTIRNLTGFPQGESGRITFEFHKDAEVTDGLEILGIAIAENSTNLPSQPIKYETSGFYQNSPFRISREEANAKLHVNEGPYDPGSNFPTPPEGWAYKLAVKVGSTVHTVDPRIYNRGEEPPVSNSDPQG